jgi:uncharacterized protein
MLIDLKDIAREGTVVERVLALGLLKGDREEPIPVGSSRVSALLSRGLRGLEFNCHMESSLDLCCVRCLDPFRLPVSSDFHLVFVPTAGPQGATAREPGERQLGEEDCDLYPVSEGKVDLDQVVREQLYLSIPLKPLCRAECAGLCARCGANRNTGSCDCPLEVPPGEGASITRFPRLTKSE